MPSYKRERDLAVSILERVAQEKNTCAGCIGEYLAKCVYGRQMALALHINCDKCGKCICSDCHNQKHWMWRGDKTPEDAWQRRENRVKYSIRRVR